MKQFDSQFDPRRALARASQNIEMSSAMKKRIKAKLMKRIGAESEVAQLFSLGSVISSLAREVHMPRPKVAEMRKRLVSFASLDTVAANNTPFFRPMFGFFRFGLSGALVIAIVTVSVFGFGGAPTAYAKQTVLNDLSGDVYVYRDGMLIPAVNGFALEQGDRLHTGYDSSASILFSDDTVSRVGSEAKINLSALDNSLNGVITVQAIIKSTKINLSALDNSLNGVITVGLARGRMWSRVMGVMGGSFNVATLHTLVRADKNATFDVKAQDEGVEVAVVSHFVDVELSSYSPAIKTTVVEGESLTFKDGKSAIVAVNTDDEWVRKNLSKDEFDSKLIAQKEEADLESTVGALPDTPLYGMKTFKENLGVVLTLNEREKFQEELKIASNRLSEAEVLIKKGLLGLGDEALNEYKQRMLAIIAQYPDLVGIDDVQKQLESIILYDQRRHASTLPGSSLGKVKRVLNEVEFLIANDQVRADLLSLRHASDRLFQSLELVKKGGSAIAAEALNEYSTVFEETFLHISSYNHEDQDEFVQSAFIIVLGDIKSLKALAEIVDTDELGHVKKVMDTVVSTMETFVDGQEGDIYAAMQKELDSVTSTNLQVLVRLSQFVGVNSENAATVDVEETDESSKNIEESATDDTEVELSGN